MATKVALVHLEFSIPGARSLKDKRRAVKSFKDRLANRFNVSIAEVDFLDDRRRAVLAAVMVANDGRYLESAMQKIINSAENQREMVLAAEEIQWL